VQTWIETNDPVLNGRNGDKGMTRDFYEGKATDEQRSKDLGLLVKIAAFIIGPASVGTLLLSIARATHLIQQESPMDPAVALALIAVAPPTLASAVGIFIALRNGKRVEDVHVEINSRMTQLLALTRKASHAEGMKDQKDDQEIKDTARNGGS